MRSKLNKFEHVREAGTGEGSLYRGKEAGQGFSLMQGDRYKHVKKSPSVESCCYKLNRAEFTAH